MKRNLCILDEFVDLMEGMMLEGKFVQEYKNVHDKFHEYEMISADFKYKDNLTEKYRSEVDWNKFRNFILDDFKKLPYPPSHLYVGFNEITANWFTSDEHLLNELKSEEIEIVLKNLEKQLKNLTVCDLIELYPISGERDITKKMYFFNYYRKKQFEKLLLENK